MAKYLQHPERFPSTYRGVQINVCRNPRCENYGVPPLSEIPRSRKGVARDHFHDGYHRSSNGDGVVTIKCLKCKENPYAKSNIAVVEEVDRLTASVSLQRSV